MRHLFYTTYWANFEDLKGFKYHEISGFIFYKTPGFFSWINNKIRKIQKESNTKIILISCGKI